MHPTKLWEIVFCASFILKCCSADTFEEKEQVGLGFEEDLRSADTCN